MGGNATAGRAGREPESVFQMRLPDPQLERGARKRRDDKLGWSSFLTPSPPTPSPPQPRPVVTIPTLQDLSGGRDKMDSLDQGWPQLQVTRTPSHRSYDRHSSGPASSIPALGLPTGASVWMCVLTESTRVVPPTKSDATSTPTWSHSMEKGGFLFQACLAHFFIISMQNHMMLTIFHLSPNLSNS